MATATIIAKRRAEALGAINTASEVLAERFGMELNVLPKKINDPELERVVHLETIAETLNQLVEATKAEDKSKKKK